MRIRTFPFPTRVSFHTRRKSLIPSIGVSRDESININCIQKYRIRQWICTRKLVFFSDNHRKNCLKLLISSTSLPANTYISWKLRLIHQWRQWTGQISFSRPTSNDTRHRRPPTNIPNTNRVGYRHGDINGFLNNIFYMALYIYDRFFNVHLICNRK